MDLPLDTTADAYRAQIEACRRMGGPGRAVTVEQEVLPRVTRPLADLGIPYMIGVLDLWRRASGRERPA